MQFNLIIIGVLAIMTLLVFVFVGRSQSQSQSPRQASSSSPPAAVPRSLEAPPIQSSSSLSPLTMSRAFSCGGRESSPPNLDDCFFDRPLRIAFIGDSIVEGNGTLDAFGLGNKPSDADKAFEGCWPADVARQLRKRADRCEKLAGNASNSGRRIFLDVRNFAVRHSSISCHATPFVRHPNYQRFLAFKADVIFLSIGTNDCLHNCPCECVYSWPIGSPPGTCNKCYEKEYTGEFDVGRFRRLYKELLEEATRHNPKGTLVVLGTPPPILESSFYVKLNMYRYERFKTVIIPEIRSIAKQLGLPMFDLQKLWMKRPQYWPGLFKLDGIHPTAAGHRLIARDFLDFVCS